MLVFYPEHRSDGNNVVENKRGSALQYKIKLPLIQKFTTTIINRMFSLRVTSFEY